jgi:hypothetical protein
MRVIDHHDDLGELFLSSGPVSSCTSLLKEASWREQSDLLDRDFALILVDDQGREHRKFACHDAGNAALSEFYLLNAPHGLGPDAMKIAAANIQEAAQAYGMTAHVRIDELASERATVNTQDSRRVMEKAANYSASSAGDGGLGALYAKAMGSNPMTQAKTMATGGVVSTPTLALIGEDGPEAVVPLTKKTAKVKKLKEIVKNASTSPFDILVQLQQDWDSIDEYGRRDVSVPLCKLASVSGMEVPYSIYKYAGETLNKNFPAIMQDRKNFTTREDLCSGYDRLSKIAAAMPLSDVVEATHLLDEQAGLYGRYGDRIPHPILAVYSQEKAAEYSWSSGGDFVSERMLKSYSGSTASDTAMKALFSEKTLEGFRADPLKSFKAMPEEQKILVARMASQSRETDDGGF